MNTTVTLECPECSEQFEVEVSYHYDAGEARSWNSPGEAPSEELEFSKPVATCRYCRRPFTVAESEAFYASACTQARENASHEYWGPDEPQERD